jgi:hypothetical protein
MSVVTSFVMRARSFCEYVLYHLASRTFPCLLTRRKKWICGRGRGGASHRALAEQQSQASGRGLPCASRQACRRMTATLEELQPLHIEYVVCATH